MLKSDERKRIVVLGGGFGGSYCARALAKRLRSKDVEVVLLDRHNYMVFSPLLVEAGTGSLEPRHAVVPMRDFVGEAEFRMAEVVGLDREARAVRYHLIGEETERRMVYDHAVIALGSVTRLPDVPGLREWGYELKSLTDAVTLRDRMIEMLERAEAVDDEAMRKRLLHVTVVGGNYSGVETAGEFGEFMRRAATRYRRVKAKDCRVTLVELSQRILPALDEDLARYAEEKLKERGTEVVLGTTVTEVREEEAVLRDGRVLGTCTVIWTAGIAPVGVAAELGVERNELGYLECDDDLRVKGEENLWAIGDLAVNRDPDGRAYPPTAQHAVREGVAAAENIVRVMGGQPTKRFAYRSKGALAPLGCRTAVAKVKGVKLSGFAAWFLWRTVYLMKMPTLKRKVRVALDWTVELFFRRDYVQLGLHRARMSENRAERRSAA